MSRINEALKLVEPAVSDKLMKHPMLTGLLESGTFSRDNYLVYLRETYHLVTHTPIYLAMAAGHCIGDTWLCNWLLDLAVDERGHNKLCVRDITAMGEDASAILAGQPSLGAWMMIAQNHYLAQHNPVGLIGFAMVTEGMGADLASRAAKIIKDKCPFGQGATAFLDTHAQEDQAHYRTVVNAFERYSAVSGAYDAIVHTWLRTIDGYAQLFTDVLEARRHQASH